MTITVLVDNRTTDQQFGTEHGLSLLLDTGSLNILLDTGASDMLIRNAQLMGIDLATTDYVFLSHGHSDHTGGLRHFIGVNKQAPVIVSPYAVSGKFFSKRKYYHSITPSWEEISADRLLLVDDTCNITKRGKDCQNGVDDILVIAHIRQQDTRHEQPHPLPQGNRHLFVQDSDGTLIPDDFRHELALYVNGLLFTGCAHNGLENMLAACPWPVHTVVGGFHLLDGEESDEQLTAIANRLVSTYPQICFYTSHCTGDHVFATLKKVMGDQLHAFSCGTRIITPAIGCK